MLLLLLLLLLRQVLSRHLRGLRGRCQLIAREAFYAA